MAEANHSPANRNAPTLRPGAAKSGSRELQRESLRPTLPPPVIRDAPAEDHAEEKKVQPRMTAEVVFSGRRDSRREED